MMSESSEDQKKVVKRKKDKKRHRREEREREMDEFNKETFKKMKQEIEEMRKKETEREKELEDLKNRIDSRDLEKEIPITKVEYALDFDRDVYLRKGFIESAKWIKEVTAANLMEKMNEEKHKKRFESLTLAKRASIHLGMRTCARFNRGEECNLGRWHMTHKDASEPIRPKQLWTRNHQQQQHQTTTDRSEVYSRRNEIRLHACTLCLDTFGAAFGHSALNCPWILKKNWKEDEDENM